MAFRRSPLYYYPAVPGVYSRPDYLYPSRSPSPAPARRPAVISIPVRDVNSDDAATVSARIRATSPMAIRSSAAIKIQKAVRGFFVRMNVKMVRKIEAEVKEIERKVKNEEEMDLIARNEKERLKINEMLMALLLRLDSVRGVRDYRKKVIRKVIMLQETVDSISAVRLSDQTSQVTNTDEIKTLESDDLALKEVETLGESEQSGDLAIEEAETLGDPEVSNPDEIKIPVDGASMSDAAVDNTAPESEPRETPEVTGQDEIEAKILDTAADSDPMETSQITEPDEIEANTLEVAEQPSPQDAKLDCRDEISADWEIIETENQYNQESAMDEEKEESVEIPGKDETLESKEKKMMVDVMEKMVAENEKLKGLVAELCQRSALQCKLMGGLAERVENLERVVEKMEKRRKKQRKLEMTSLDKTTNFNN